MRNGRYAPIHLHRHGDRHKDRHKDREIWRWREAIHPDAYLSGLVGFSVGWFGSVGLSVHFGSVRFGSLWFGSDF